MKVWSELERAQLENLASDPSAGIAGRIFYNTTDGKFRFDDGTDIREVLTSEYGADLGYTILDSKILLDANYFPDTTSLYGWNAFAQGTLADADWIGSEDLTDVGTITYGADHLGTANNAIVLNGTTQCVHTTGTSFDDTGSFTAWAWIKPDASGEAAIISKFNSTNADRSFYFYRTSTSLLRIRVYYNASGGSVDLDASDTTLDDGSYHFICAVYDQSATSLMLYIDDICVGYKIDSSLSARNNSATADLTFGAYDGSGTPSSFFDGSIGDFGYKKTALTSDQVRKVYAAGSRKFCTESDSGDVYINGKQPARYYVYPTSTQTITATSFGTPVSGYSSYIAENGEWDLTFHGHGRCADAAAAQMVYQLRTRLTGGASGTTKIPGSFSAETLEISNAAGNITLDDGNITIHTSTSTYANKDDIIRVEAFKGVAVTTTQLQYFSNLKEPYLLLEKDM